MVTVPQVIFGHSHPASCDPPTGPAHVTLHVTRGVTVKTKIAVLANYLVTTIV